MASSDYHISPPAGTHVKLSDVPLGGWYPLLMQWKVPVLVSIVYATLAFYSNYKIGKRLSVAKNIPNPSAVKTNTSPKKESKKSVFAPMTMIVLIHNTVLAVYSAWAFWGVFPAFVQKIIAEGWHGGLCDMDGMLWNTVLFKHVYLFYISKFYELLDTAIIIAKGRKASFLQIYHHAGVIVIMFLANYYSSAASIFIVWENAGVHTIMYTYYALTAIGINPPGKQYLTSLQIFQFLFGQSFVLLYMVTPNCQSSSQRVWLWALTAYLLPLIYLFVQFFSKTYNKMGVTATRESK
ncbi:fatty acid elongase [Coemansia reversa NRRL 1564]|uniref:Elongation of fatty acids protein n=1 Tax=Coemansia reversa (strain ATCC 12441 / NRRL 1564) TaxID=763665 RepID=A0A2G5BCF7_COERN|nr:fatty acid elongase [Coemansia reversa NRRL 1564]|eukprot:PIA16672.1 fatty acid elongase [Coemansia reversa NRRL 1564]